jgi:ABC-2 type transport system permease protein
MAAPSAGRPALWPAALRVLDLTLGQMLWSRRSVFLAVLVAGPVVLAAVLRILAAAEPAALPRIQGARLGGAALFGTMIWLLYVRFAVPALGVFYGTALIADEVEDRTITYLFVRPIPRGAVLLGKYLAYLICTALLVLPSVVLVYFLVVPIGGGSIGAAFPQLAADLGILAAGLATYGAVFAFAGARLKRPLVAGLIFAFGWEPGALLFPGYPGRLTVAYYLQGLVPHAMPDDSSLAALMRLFQTPPSLLASLGALAGLTLGALWLAMRTVERREYVLEQ